MGLHLQIKHGRKLTFCKRRKEQGEAELSRDRELLKWSRAEHCGFEEKEEEKEDGKSKESRQK